MSQKRSAEDIDTVTSVEDSSSQIPHSKKIRSVRAVPRSNPNPVDSNGLSECFKKVKSTLYVSLAPSYLNSPVQGIKTQHLDPLLMKYSEKLRGVILGYSEVSIVYDNKDDEEEEVLAKINPHSPFAFLWVNANFLVWRPKVGDVVEGLVYMQSPSHIGLLIHDTFNASIKKFNIPEDWTFVPNQEDEAEEEDVAQIGQDDVRRRSNILGQWVDANEVPIDGKLKVTIKTVRTGSRVISLEATLITPEQESTSLPVVPGGKKIKFDDLEPLADEKTEETTTAAGDIPGYSADSDDEVVAQSDSSDDEDDESD